MYAIAHHDPTKPEPPYPQQLPRPGDVPAEAPAPAPASKYLALADVPAATPAELAVWLKP